MIQLLWLLSLAVYVAEGESDFSSCPSQLSSWTTLVNCETTGRTGSGKSVGSVTMINCRFTSWISTGSYGGICRIDSAEVNVTGSNFTKCGGIGSSCFSCESGTVTVNDCWFRENLGPQGTGYTNVKFGYNYGFGCICFWNEGESKCDVSGSYFVNNANGVLGAAGKSPVSPGVQCTLTSCVFEDGKFSPRSGTPGVSEGGQMLVDYGTITFTACTFTITPAHKGPLNGWALVVKNSPTIILDGCTFTKEKEDANVCSVVLATPTLTMRKCSFVGNSLHIKAQKTISVTIQECLQFSNDQTQAWEGVTFVNSEGEAADDLVKYNGEECPKPSEPTTEEPSEGGEEPGPEPEPGASVSDDPEGGGGEPEPGASDSGPVFPSGKPSDDDDDDDEDDDDDDDDSKGGKNKLSGGEIAAIVIVVLIVIAAIVAVLLFFLVFRRRYGSKSSGTGEEATSEVTTTEEVVTGTGAVNQQYGGDFGLWDSEAPESDPGSKEQ